MFYHLSSRLYIFKSFLELIHRICGFTCEYFTPSFVRLSFGFDFIWNVIRVFTQSSFFVVGFLGDGTEQILRQSKVKPGKKYLLHKMIHNGIVGPCTTHTINHIQTSSLHCSEGKYLQHRLLRYILLVLFSVNTILFWPCWYHVNFASHSLRDSTSVQTSWTYTQSWSLLTWYIENSERLKHYLHIHISSINVWNASLCQVTLPALPNRENF